MHLVLVGSDGFPPTVPQLIQQIALGRIRDLRRTGRAGAQSAGRGNSADSSGYAQAHAPAAAGARRRGAHRRGVSNSLGAPPVRLPAQRRQRALAHGRRSAKLLASRAPVFIAFWTRYGCRTTDHFAGFQLTGRYDAAELARLIRQLPEGVTEFMCHPGFCTEELQAARTRLKESRRRELDALTSREVRKAIEESNVTLTRYAEIR